MIGGVSKKDKKAQELGCIAMDRGRNLALALGST